jgi:hypothetical protein
MFREGQLVRAKRDWPSASSQTRRRMEEAGELPLKKGEIYRVHAAEGNTAGIKTLDDKKVGLGLWWNGNGRGIAFSNGHIEPLSGE